MAERSISTSWEELFDRHDILRKVKRDGFFRITSKQIKTVKEPRLMAKFDQSSALPGVFRDNGLAILPVTRGEYVIGPYNAYAKLTYPSSRPASVEIPNLQTLDGTNLYSEAAALLFAFNSGVIADIAGSNHIDFTVAGRMASGQFAYGIDSSVPGRPKQHIQVANAQIEIDAGYETDDCFYVFEAKNVAGEDMLVRQLYYPYRLWSSKISKPVIPVFLVYSNNVFYASVYAFDDTADYSSLRLVQSRSYALLDQAIHVPDVQDAFSRAIVCDEPDVTFPQADSFERIVDLLSVLNEQDLSRDEVTVMYGFDERQTNYYITACRYLRLVETFTQEHVTKYRLTPDARDIMGRLYREKYLALASRILERPLFNKAFALAIDNACPPSTEACREIMREADLPLNLTTRLRRASTLRAWVEWMFRICE